MKTIIMSVLALVLGSAVRAAGLPDAPYVYAIGSASREVAADQVTLSFALVERSKDAKVASALVEDGAKKVMGILREFGVTDKDIAAASVSTRPRYDDDTGEVFLGYEVTRDFSFVLRDVTRYGDLVKALIEAPVQELKLKLIASSKEAEIVREVEKHAREAAKREGDMMASAFNMEVSGVFAVSPLSYRTLNEQWPHGARAESWMTARASGGESNLTFILPPVVIRREAHVIFLIQKATK